MVHQGQVGNLLIRGIVNVGPGPYWDVSVHLHGNQGGEVAPCVAQGNGALPAEAALPQQRQVNTCNLRMNG